MTCNKKGYDKRDAVTAKNFREKNGTKNLRVYHHEECNQWHLTKTRKWSKEEYLEYKDKTKFYERDQKN